MSDGVRVVSVYGETEESLVDLTLPAQIPLAALLPDIVDLAGPGSGAQDRPWRLARIDGPALDHRMTLVEQGVEDGDLLLLSAAEITTPGVERKDLLSRILAAAPAPPSRAVRPALGSVSAALGVLACVGAPAGSLVAMTTVAVLLAGALLAAIIWARGHSASPAGAPLSALAVTLAAVCGFRAVPGDTSVAHVALAATTAATISLILLRCRAGQTTAMTAVACLSVVVGAVSLGAVLWPMPGASVGALLVLSALVGLGAAPRISVLLARLAPATAVSVDAHDHRAAMGHRVLAGLVMGCSTLAAGGAVVVGWAAVGGSTPRLAATVLCAVAGVAVMLRARTYASGRCRYALLIAGSTCSACTLAVIVLVAPHYAHWVGAVLVGAGAAVLMRDDRPEPSPVAVRAIELLEYGALAAVTPLACAVLGVFSLVREMSLG